MATLSDAERVMLLESRCEAIAGALRALRPVPPREVDAPAETVACLMVAATIQLAVAGIGPDQAVMMELARVGYDAMSAWVRRREGWPAKGDAKGGGC